MPSRLSGKQIAVIRDAIVSGFTRDTLRAAVLLNLDEDLEVIAEGGTLDALALSLIAWAQRTNRVRPLIAALAEVNPHNPEVQDLVRQSPPWFLPTAGGPRQEEKAPRPARGAAYSLLATGLLLLAVLLWLGSRSGASAEPPAAAPTATSGLTFESQTPAPLTDVIGDSGVSPGGGAAPVHTAALTAAALAPSPTDTVAPTATPVPTPAATSTPADAAARLVANEQVNIRGGPGTEYAWLGAANAGDEFDVTGRNAAGDWWQVAYAGGPAWIVGLYVTATGVEDVPVIADIPPAPTAIPAPPTLPPPTPTDAPPPAAPTAEPSPLVCWNGSTTEQTTEEVPPRGSGIIVTLVEVRFERPANRLVVQLLVENKSAQSIRWGFGTAQAVAVFPNISPVALERWMIDVPAKLPPVPYTLEAGIAQGDAAQFVCPTLLLVKAFDGQTEDIRFDLD